MWQSRKATCRRRRKSQRVAASGSYQCRDALCIVQLMVKIRLPPGLARYHVLSRIAAVVLCYLLASAALAAVQPAGSPPFERHTPDIDVFPQNFSIAQDSRGVVYVGNLEGVLEFDGGQWALLRLPNQDIVRSLAVGADDRVYVGGYNAFGYLQRNAAGQSEFVDLTANFREQIGDSEFADIWSIAVAPEGVYFKAVRDLFLWSPEHDRPRHWHHAERFGALRQHRGKTLLQFRGEGLRSLVADEWQPVPGTGDLKGLIFDLLPLADGSLLSQGSDGAWWRIEAGGIRPQPMPEGLPPSSRFEHALVLADSSVVLAGNDGEIYLLDPALRTTRHFSLDSGFISGLHRAVDGGFLASGDRSIFRIEWPSAWSVLGQEHGIDGDLLGTGSWNGVDYLLSSQGAWPIQPAADGSPSLGHPAPWSESQWLYDLIGLDAQRALLAHSHRLGIVERGEWREWSSELIYPRLFVASRYRRERILIGTEFGLRSLDDEGGGLRLSAITQPDLATRVTSLVERSATEIWLGTERHGLWRYRYDAGGQLLESVRLDPQLGIVSGPLAAVQVSERGDRDLLVATHSGFWIGDGERFEKSDLDGLESLRHENELLSVVPAANGGEWAYGHARLFQRQPGQSWREHEVSHLRRGALITHNLQADGAAQFVSSQALLSFEPDADDRPDNPPRMLLRSVSRLAADGEHQPLPIQTQLPLRLPAGDFAIHFNFALPELSRAGSARFRGRLVGYEEAFSEWSAARNYSYWRLRPGHYRLELQARDSKGRISEIQPYSLIIEPAWYETLAARSGTAVLLLMLLGLTTRGYVRWRTARVAADNLRLEATVEARTHQLAEANRQLDTMAHLDGLTGIANRRRLDAYLPGVWKRCAEQKRPLALLLIDVDLFKHYNDQHGHLAGDDLLCSLCRLLSDCMRRSEDLLSRYGGEEFLVVLPGADATLAAELAERMRQTVENSELAATISIGVASCVPDPASNFTALLEATDAALYLAKNDGRNRVVVQSWPDHPAVD